MAVGALPKPPPGGRPQVLQILELAPVEEVGLEVGKGLSTLPFVSAPPAGDGFAFVVGDEGDEGRVVDRLSGFPAQEDGLLAIVEALLGHAAEVLEGVHVPADEGEEVATAR